MSFEAHNAEVREVWEAYNAGDPIRVPMTLGINPRLTLLDPALNPEGITFQQYFEDPRVMLDVQLRHQHWVRHNLVFDQEMGLPERWSVYVDFQNCYEALWWGGEPRYLPGNVPDVPPFVTDDRKHAFVKDGAPDPFGGWMARNWQVFDDLKDLAADAQYEGRAVDVAAPTGLGTDGPFTIGCALRGPTELCIDMYADPDFYDAFMDLITEGTIGRITAYRERLGQEVATRAWGFADDSVQLLSVDTYREKVLPYHRRLIEAFGPDGPNSIHLCGDATHLFPTIRDELKVMAFDTGFPVDHGALRQAMGPEVAILGGPHVELLRSRTPEEVREEARRILQSGIKDGGRFVLREGNNLAPGTPPANVAAMYAACKEFGGY
jgi:hypothetical protein